MTDARCQQIIKAAKAIQITTANMAVQAVKRFHISGFFSVNWLSLNSRKIIAISTETASHCKEFMSKSPHCGKYDGIPAGHERGQRQTPDSGERPVD